MNAEIEYVRRLIVAVVAQLGQDAPDWQIAAIGYQQIDNKTIDDEPTNTIQVSLESGSGRYSPVAVNFSLNVPLADATREIAGQVQDHAVETTRGASIPPCPGHRHPLTPSLVDGVPKWVCMTDGAGYYAKDILSRFDPRYTLVEYIQDNPIPA